jgi:hypothetical protein
MSPEEFMSLVSEHGAAEPALAGVGQWLRSHPTIRFIEPKRVAKDLKISERDLVRVLSVLVSAGRLRAYYKVRPRTSNTFVDELFTSVGEIPRKLLDAFSQPIDLDDAEIVTVFGGEMDAALAR